jgi:penicillin-binding protein 1C
VSLYDLAQAFSLFPRDGLNQSGTQVMERDASRLVCAFLSDPLARSTGFGTGEVFRTAYPSIFKTGTANQYQSIVALGATSGYTVAVWMGNLSGETVLGATGSSVPALIVRQTLDRLFYAGPEPLAFAAFPEPLNYRLEEVCVLSGRTPGPLCTIITREYMRRGDTNAVCTGH